MKVKLLTIFSMMLLMSLVLASPAMAAPAEQGPISCSTGYAAQFGNPFFTPAVGPAGTSFTVTGIGATANVMSGVELWWDSGGAPQLLGSMVGDAGGNYSGTFTVPADAADGVHSLVIWPWDGAALCMSFTVGAAVQPDTIPPTTVAPLAETPAAPISVLPSTGFFLLIPAAGFVSAGMGTLIVRRRNR